MRAGWEEQQEEEANPPLYLESWRRRRRGGPSGQVTVDWVKRLSRVGYDSEVEVGA